MKAKQLFYAFALGVLPARQRKRHGPDSTAGLPVDAAYSRRREMGMDSGEWFVPQDRLGRFFVGGNGLVRFRRPGMESRYAIGKARPLRPNHFQFGKIASGWAAATRWGISTEPVRGRFPGITRCSSHLPEDERESVVKATWGSGHRGFETDLLCRSQSKPRIVGTERPFGTWRFPAKARIFCPLTLATVKLWIHHRESGLVPPHGGRAKPRDSQARLPLPDAGILWPEPRLAARILLVGGERGFFFRPEHAPPAQVFDPRKISRFIGRKSGSTCYAYGWPVAVLRRRYHGWRSHVADRPDGRIGMSGILDADNRACPANAVFSITEDASGYLWCSTIDGVYRLRRPRKDRCHPFDQSQRSFRPGYFSSSTSPPMTGGRI